MRIVPFHTWADGIHVNGVPQRMPLPAPRHWLHHGAAGDSTVETARQYLRGHLAKGWTTIGYSFLIAEGLVLEGRGPGRVGAHTQGDNDESHGTCMVGSYTDRPPSAQDLDALRWLLSHGEAEGWWRHARITGGHRDAPGARTSCPGAALHRLIPAINEEDDMPLTPNDLAQIRQIVEDEIAPVVGAVEDVQDTTRKLHTVLVDSHLRPIRRALRALLKPRLVTVDEVVAELAALDVTEGP